MKLDKLKVKELRDEALSIERNLPHRSSNIQEDVNLKLYRITLLQFVAAADHLMSFCDNTDESKSK